MDRIDVAGRSAQLGRDRAGTRGCRRSLSDLAGKRAQIGSIWLVDADGRARLSSTMFPQPDIGSVGPRLLSPARRPASAGSMSARRSPRAPGGAHGLHGLARIAGGRRRVRGRHRDQRLSGLFRRVLPHRSHRSSTIPRGWCAPTASSLVRDAAAVPSTEQPAASENFFRATAQADEGAVDRRVADTMASAGSWPNKKLESYPVYRALRRRARQRLSASWRR